MFSTLLAGTAVPPVLAGTAVAFGQAPWWAAAGLGLASLIAAVFLHHLKTKLDRDCRQMLKEERLAIVATGSPDCSAMLQALIGSDDP